MNCTVEEKKSNNIRFSGIDLLKIIAILLICFTHANQTLGNFINFPTFSISNAVFMACSTFGSMGNILFVICSSYFLADKTKTSGEKAINLLLDSMTISIIILSCFLLSGSRFDPATIIKQVFPDVFALNWFVPCYVVFYLLAPIVVFGLRNLSKKAHFCIVLISLASYGLLSFIKLEPVGSNLLNFFYILNIVSFVKWHLSDVSKKTSINFAVFIIGMVILFSFYLGFILLAKHIDFFSNFYFFSMLSPLQLVPLIALFNLFCNMKFNNRIISYLSTCSLFVYVIHENFLLRSITRPYYYEHMFSSYGDSYAIVYMVSCALFMFFVGFILSVIYKESVHRLTKKLSHFLYLFGKKVYHLFYYFVFKER